MDGQRISDRDAYDEIFSNKQRLKIYWYLLNKGDPAGVREIQRTLGVSSPSVVHHHLDKLKDVDLVRQDEHGRYILIRSVQVGILQGFLKVGRFMLPRFSFYAAFFTTLLASYVVGYFSVLDTFALVFGISAVLVTWIETIRVWRGRPF
jgi:DNA-binding transcriptional ArsR family regulator